MELLKKKKRYRSLMHALHIASSSYEKKINRNLNNNMTQKTLETKNRSAFWFFKCPRQATTMDISSPNP